MALRPPLAPASREAYNHRPMNETVITSRPAGERPVGRPLVRAWALFRRVLWVFLLCSLLTTSVQADGYTGSAYAGLAGAMDALAADGVATIDLWGDFRCSACYQFTVDGTMAQIESQQRACTESGRSSTARRSARSAARQSRSPKAIMPRT